MPESPTVDALVGVITSLRVELAAEREQARREISRLVKMVEGLTAQLDVLLRDQAEERRAELAKLREAAKATLAAAPSPSLSPPPSPPAPKASRRDKHGRQPIPAELPRDTTRVRSAKCSGCSGDRLDQEKVLASEEWDYVRAHLRVRRTERVLCVCRDCGHRVVPEHHPMPFERASATFPMVAWLCFAKVGLFLPLDRIQRDFKDQGARIGSSTLTRWWQRGADLLLPIAQAVRVSLLARSHIRTDGTGLLVVFQKLKGKPKKGREREGPTDEDGYLIPKVPHNGQILVFGDDEHAVFHFTPTRHGHHAVGFLTLGADADGKPILWKGTITADAVSSQNLLFTDGDRIESGCNAHGLRKFRDDADKAPLLASRALGFIGRFYSEEARAREQGLVGLDLLAWRKKHIAPVATEFRLWLDDQLDDEAPAPLLPTNPVRKAMQYYINHWRALTRFLEDPDVPLDNNWSERALRSVNLIRNNSLYAGGEDGAVRLTSLLTLITTARLLGLNPYEYLRWAMAGCVPHSTNRGRRPADLTPAAYKAAQDEDAR